MARWPTPDRGGRCPCTRRTPRDRLRAMLGTVADDELPDEYGRGGRVAALEQRVADLLGKGLGKGAAVLMPTGTMASQVALRLHADARGTRTVGFALLAGPADLVAQARDWRARLGGQLYHAWPLAVTAEHGLDRWLPRMPAYWRRAGEIATALAGVHGVDVVPVTPQTPLFHVHLHAPKAALDRAHTAHVDEGGLQLYLYARTTTNPAWSRFEITVGEPVMEVAVADVRSAVETVLRRAGSFGQALER